MTTSPLGIELITGFEKLSLEAYDTDGAHVWTIGWGTTRVNGQPVTEGMVCTKEQADAWFATELHHIEPVVSSASAKVLLQHQFDALVSFTYNVGIAGFESSTIYRKLQSDQSMWVAEANFSVWNKVKDEHGSLVPSDGLTRRRKAEWWLYSTGQVKFF